MLVDHLFWIKQKMKQNIQLPKVTDTIVYCLFEKESFAIFKCNCNTFYDGFYDFVELFHSKSIQFIQSWWSDFYSALHPKLSCNY